MQKKRILFSVFLAGFSAIIFLLNSNHINQQGTYDNVFLKISDAIIGGYGYTSAEFNFQPSTYPLWGFTFVVMLDKWLHANNLLVMSMQYLLCLISLYFFYKLFRIEPKYYHALIFLPFIALMSVKWPDAFVGGFLLPYVYYTYRYIKTGKIKLLIISSLFLGFLSNFRSEYLFLPLTTLLLIISSHYREYWKDIVTHSVLVFLLVIVFVTPWAYRAKSISGEFKYGATNGGAVAYNCLGQLPGNPWKIKPLDQSSFDYLNKNFPGIHPYSAVGDRLMQAEFIRQVSLYPWDYGLKVLNNMSKVLTGGVYTGEYANVAIGKYQRIDEELRINNISGLTGKLKAISNLGFPGNLLLIAEKTVQFAFVPVLLLFFLVFFFSGWLINSKKIKLSPDIDFHLLWGLVYLLIMYKIIISGLIQYEYRHTNSIYLLLAGVFLLLLPAIGDFLKFRLRRKSD